MKLTRIKRGKVMYGAKQWYKYIGMMVSAEREKESWQEEKKILENTKEWERVNEECKWFMRKETLVLT